MATRFCNSTRGNGGSSGTWFAAGTFYSLSSTASKTLLSFTGCNNMDASLTGETGGGSTACSKCARSTEGRSNGSGKTWRNAFG